METSIFLAQLMGIFSLAMGFSMLAKRKMLISIFHELSDSRALSYILGTLMFLLGLLVILNHNVWELSPRIIITIIGWIILVEGGSYLFVSKETLSRYLAFLDNRKIYYVIAFGYLVLGSYLAYFGL
jgi:uncharacterized membrane protein HdeD (DUF308 family)